MSNRPVTAQCRTVLGSGELATITATRRPRGALADVKCTVPGAPQLAARMQQVVRLARLTEARLDGRDQVLLAIDRLPAAEERDWELAAVLADRLVRGAWAASGTPCANGWSDAWHLGRVDGHAPVRAPADALLGGTGGIGHLGALSGHPDPAAAVSSARAWFPLHSGGSADSLCWVEVSVHPLDAPGAEEEDSIALPSHDAAMQLAVRETLAAARQFDLRGLGRWSTVVRFGAPQFQGRSFELALVMADRLARGREFAARGRLLASGCSGAWHAGRVDSVEGREAKLALIEREAVDGDRVLLPADWADDAFAVALRARGASVAWVDRIGII